MSKKEQRPQSCKTCEEPLILTEVTTDMGKKVWVYMCGCDEMVREAKQGDLDCENGRVFSV